MNNSLFLSLTLSLAPKDIVHPEDFYYTLHVAILYTQTIPILWCFYKIHFTPLQFYLSNREGKLFIQSHNSVLWWYKHDKYAKMSSIYSILGCWGVWVRAVPGGPSRGTVIQRTAAGEDARQTNIYRGGRTIRVSGIMYQRGNNKHQRVANCLLSIVIA